MTDALRDNRDQFEAIVEQHAVVIEDWVKREHKCTRALTVEEAERSRRLIHSNQQEALHHEVEQHLVTREVIVQHGVQATAVVEASRFQITQYMDNRLQDQSTNISSKLSRTHEDLQHHVSTTSTEAIQDICDALKAQHLVTGWEVSIAGSQAVSLISQQLHQAQTHVDQSKSMHLHPELVAVGMRWHNELQRRLLNQPTSDRPLISLSASTLQAKSRHVYPQADEACTKGKEESDPERRQVIPEAYNNKAKCWSCCECRSINSYSLYRNANCPACGNHRHCEHCKMFNFAGEEKSVHGRSKQPRHLTETVGSRQDEKWEALWSMRDHLGTQPCPRVFNEPFGFRIRHIEVIPDVHSASLRFHPSNRWKPPTQTTGVRFVHNVSYQDRPRQSTLPQHTKFVWVPPGYLQQGVPHTHSVTRMKPAEDSPFYLIHQQRSFGLPTATLFCTSHSTALCGTWKLRMRMTLCMRLATMKMTRQ